MDASEIDLCRANATRFAHEYLQPMLAALNHYPDAPLPDRIVPTMTEMGLFDLGFDGDGGTRALCAVLEAIARVAAAPAAVLFAHVMARECVRAAGGECADGAVYAYPIYAEAGHDAVANDCARLVANAPIATVVVVPTKSGIATLEADAPGVRIGEPVLTLGMRGCPTADVSFDTARIAPVRVRDVAARLRGAAAAISAGILGESLARAAEYAKQRWQGGCPIIEHEEVRAILARMMEDHATCRDAVDRLSREKIAESRSLALFVRAKQRVAHAACDGVQLLGGNGYMEDYGQERCMRDAKQAQCLLGRIDVSRQEAVAALVAEGAAS